MPDPKPPQPTPAEPIALKDLIQSFAATVVATSQHLDQATVDLRNLYVNSGNLSLASMIPPRYLLDEVTIDVSFVIVEAKPDVPETTQLPDADKNVSKTTLQVTNPSNADLLHSKLSDLAKANALADAKAKSAQTNTEIQNLQKRLSDGQASLAKAQSDLSAAQKHATVRKPPLNLPDPAAIANLQRAQVSFNTLHAQFAPGGSVAGPLQAQINAFSQRKKQFDDAATMLATDPPLTSQQIASLRELGIAFVDWGQMWDDFYGKYVSLKAAYTGAVKAFQSHAGLSKMDDFQLSAADQQALQQIQGITGDKGEIRDWNTAKKSVSDIQADYLATLDALNALVRLISDIRGSGLQVLVDPKGLADAPAEARHRLHLTFHGQSQEKVKVGETDMDVTG
ncbi:MAG TPA: hypothetical protein VKY85_12865 [Candidatus Angelobacter sp.]|nr:hypothetical protein [Candidatus Angelobacter sp.]